MNIATPDRAKTTMSLYGGLTVNPFDLHWEDINLPAIAHSLANQNRYTGHTLWPYSVAQHSVLLADFVPSHLTRVALCHDMSEAYITDIARPVKVHLPDYNLMEEEIQARIFVRFGVDWDDYLELKQYDTRICRDEMLVLFPGKNYHSELVPLGVTVEEWTWTRAKAEFLNRCERYL